MELSLSRVTRGIIVDLFPWVLEYFRTDTENFEARSIDLDTLSLRPGLSSGGAIFVFNQEGSVIVRVELAETVEDALQWFRDRVDEVRYVLHLAEGKATLYAVPLKESFSTWLAKDTRRAASSLRFAVEEEWGW